MQNPSRNRDETIASRCCVPELPKAWFRSQELVRPAAGFLTLRLALDAGAAGAEDHSFVASGRGGVLCSGCQLVPRTPVERDTP